ncbi:DUF4190 domain-containing protein [Subtercola frigoramans]|uniref:DUF4190 domain-containing protein n=1 Tax=Subtercola frigoramans TaxID=120298 RepID=A0ABS2L6S8_9MICO|nr:DUF4190 domain-containing protein [Subtercola frigoramans]MBM7472773.1 hypothetical protein [Subtercola frigoramans]
MSEPESPQPAAQFNVLAIVSFVSSFIASLAGVITGHIALSQIRKTGERGHGLALAGVIIGYVRIVIDLAAVIVLVVILVLTLSHAQRVYDPGGFNPLLPTAAVPVPQGPAAADLTFEAGTKLTPDSIPQISDGLLGTAGWKAGLAKGAEGTWTYISADNLCRTTFHQGPLDPKVTVTAGDDLATTESYLALIDKTTSDDVTANASDDYINQNVVDADSVVQTRAMSGTDQSNNSFITTARAFAASGQGVFVDVTCRPTADITSVITEVLDSSAILIS